MRNERANYQVLREARPRRLPRRTPRIILNAAGWFALIGLGALVSMASAFALPLVYAIMVGAAAAAFVAYGAEYSRTG